MSKSIKVTKPGYDALTDTDPRRFNLDSDFEAVMRLQDSGSGTQHIGNGFINTTVTIPHNLGYPPFFQMFLKFTNVTAGTTTDYIYATAGTNNPLGPDALGVHPYVDNDNLTILFYTPFSTIRNIDINYYYFIGRDPLT